MSRCIVDERDDAAAAAEALRAHPAIAAVELVQPCEGPHPAWTLEATVLTGPHHDARGWEPRHQRTAADHGLTLRDGSPRGPTAFRALLAL